MTIELQALIKAAKDFKECQSIGNGAKLNCAIEDAEKAVKGCSITTATDGKPPVVGSALLDWNENVIRAKRDFAIACTKWVNSPEYKKMIEDMKRLGAIR